MKGDEPCLLGGGKEGEVSIPLTASFFLPWERLKENCKNRSLLLKGLLKTPLGGPNMRTREILMGEAFRGKRPS